MVKSSEACPPQLLELGKQLARSGDAVGIAVDDALASLLTFRHEPRLLQHGDMLLHGREGHVVPGRERRDRSLLPAEQTGDDVAARRVGQGAKEAVELRIGEVSTYNHMVVYYVARSRCARGNPQVP